jgi:ABC-2 type transport system ATP-binding protein
MSALLKTENLVKRFGSKQAVSDVSLSVSGGEVVGILGPNGAGKTTTLRMTTGFMLPTSGQAFIGGHDVVRDRLKARHLFGYLPEGSPLYGDMTVQSYLSFIASARGLDRMVTRGAIRNTMDRLELADVSDQTIETLSKGFKRRVGLAQAILHDPALLVLDEPTDGLDPNQKLSVRNLIRNMGTEKAVLISTHILEEVEAVCTRVVVISSGRIVADSTPAALRGQSRFAHAVTVTLPPGSALPETDQQFEISIMPDRRLQLTFFSPEKKPILAQVMSSMQQAALVPLDVVVEAGRLEDVFQRLTLPAETIA